LTVVLVKAVLVKLESVNQDNVPVVQVALKTLLEPEQIALGLAEALVGATGVAVTVTVTLFAVLLQVPFIQAP
jgi:hypothetical protein